MEKSTEKKMVIVYKQRQRGENFILLKPQDKRLARNLAAKRTMAAELAEMGLNQKAIARLLNLPQEKED